MSLDHYVEPVNVSGPYSPSYVAPVQKYYWVRYTLPSGHYNTKCITQHPFHFIHNYNLADELKKWAKVTLVDWKEITKEDFNIWLVINNKSSGELETGADEGIHTMD